MYPCLTEDKLIQGTKYFKAAGEEKRPETDTEFNISDPVTSGLIRVRQLQHLGQWISGLPSSRMAFKKYRTGHIIFHIKPPGEDKDSVEGEGDDGDLLAKDDQESGGPRREVMENMAKLWLEQEVKNLEGGSGQSGKRRRGRGKARLISGWSTSFHIYYVSNVLASRQSYTKTLFVFSIDGPKQNAGPLSKLTPISNTILYTAVHYFFNTTLHDRWDLRVPR